jgi:hypothetical protein
MKANATILLILSGVIVFIVCFIIGIYRWISRNRLVKTKIEVTNGTNRLLKSMEKRIGNGVVMIRDQPTSIMGDIEDMEVIPSYINNNTMNDDHEFSKKKITNKPKEIKIPQSSPMPASKQKTIRESNIFKNPLYNPTMRRMDDITLEMDDDM